MRFGNLSGAAILVVGSGCGLMPAPSFADAPAQCRMFKPGTPMEWVGHGDPVELGLLKFDPNDADIRPPGDIYVGMATEHRPIERVFCVLPEAGRRLPPQPGGGGNTYWGVVPAGWTPPP